MLFEAVLAEAGKRHVDIIAGVIFHHEQPVFQNIDSQSYFLGQIPVAVILIRLLNIVAFVSESGPIGLPVVLVGPIVLLVRNGEVLHVDDS